MGNAKTAVYKRSLLSWVFTGNAKLQILLLFVSIVMVFARVLPLEMQKRIVNDAIQLRKMDLLLIYCGIYLAAVVLASGLKFLVNFLQNVIGQRAAAEMRKQLYRHMLTLPLVFFRRTPPGMVVASLITELATAGDFIGMAVGIPFTTLLTLVAITGYLLWLDPLLAVISLSVYPLGVLLIPWLQKKANWENKARVDRTRDLSNKIAESVSGIHEIQGNGAFRIENVKHERMVDGLTKVRIRWNLFRLTIKVVNNFFNNLSPFVIFILGGYLAIQGRLELGALVAFLSAQEKLNDPWRELIGFYQSYQDAGVSYKRTMEYFDAEPEFLLEPPDRPPYELANSIEIRNLNFETETGVSLLSNINLFLKPGEQMALVGFSGSGKSTLALCVGQLYKYTGGSVLLGGKEVATLTKRDMIHNVGYVSQTPFIFDGTIEENLLYACRAKVNDDGASPAEGMPDLDAMIAVSQQTGIFVDILRFGLNMVLAPDHSDNGLVSRIIRVRKNFQDNYGKQLSDHVEFIDKNRYLYHSSIADNLIFGTPNRDDFLKTNLLKSAYFKKFLGQADLARPLMGLGADLARQMIDIVGNLPLDEGFFDQSPVRADEVEELKLLTERLRKSHLHELAAADREKLLELALRFTPGEHKMAALPGMLEKLILEGRALLRENISGDDPAALSFYDVSQYIHSETILNNILFGKTKTSSPQSQEKINQSIIQLLIAEDLLEAIIQIGMKFQVGTKGDKLSGGQRQKLAIARVFLKDPKIIVLDEATSALDNNSQARIQNLLEGRLKGKSTVLAVVHRLDIIKNYDRIAVMKTGKIAEMGTYDELMARKGMLYELVRGKK